ncbi:MAG: MFS transporter, partial [Gemmatimonadaceae bacterium]
VGQMMGIWFLAASVGNLVAGLVGGNVDPEQLAQTPVVFGGTAVALFVATLILGLMIVPIRRMMAGAK